MINLSGLPTKQHIQKSEDGELIRNVRSNSIGLMNAPPDTSNMGLRHTHRGIEPYDISKAEPVGVFDTAMSGMSANSGFEARNIEANYSKVKKSANLENEKRDSTEYIDLERLW